MARSFPGLTTDYLRIVNPIGALDISGTGPLTVSAWVMAGFSVQMGLLGKALGTGGGQTQYRMAISSGGAIIFTIGDAAGVQSLTSTGTLPLNTWGHALGVRVNTGTNGSAVYLNGVATGGTLSKTIQDTAADFTVGRNLGEGTALGGRLADVAVWAAGLTPAEIGALAKGASPLRVRPQSLAAYYPLWGVGSSGDPDLSGNGQHLTEVGTVGIADHAPVGPYAAG